MINLQIPIHWIVGRKKEFLGLNFYRNSHYQVLAKLKRQYTESLFPYLKGKKLKTPIAITYTFHPSRKSQDMDNAIAVQAKFLQDSLIHYGVIENDNYESIPLTTNMVGDKDKDGYVEVIIEEIT